MKKIIIALALLFFAATAYGFFDFGFSRVKVHSVSSGDAVLWDASGDAVLWDASGDKVLWD